VFTSFDPELAELPEGVATDRRGSTFVSLGPPIIAGGGYGAVVKIARDGTRTTLVEYPEGPAVAGLATDWRGTVHFALPNPGQSDHGVYRVTDAGAERLPGTENMVLPNGLAFNWRGDLYVSDSVLGSIWKVPRQGGPAQPWLAHDLLAGCTTEDLGANGLAFWRGDLYVASTSRGLLLKIPIGFRDMPGEPGIVAGDADCETTDELFSIDGIAFDVRGNVYAALVLINDLVRINSRSGHVTPLLNEDDGLWNPASVTFGRGSGGHRTLYITNYAVLPPVPDGNLGPAVLTYDVGVPGKPIP
jgi:sugar lactone lactonase YvrE